MLQIKNTLGGGKPEGLYVWKKYKYNPPVTVSNPSITITCPSTFGNKLNITSADIDIKTLWKDLRDTGAGKDLSKILTDADGNISEWKSSSGISIGLASSMTSKIGFVSKSGTQGISYLQEDTSLSTYCAFNMGSSTNYSSYAGTYTFDGDYKISDSSVEFIDYVVSDKETAYPDGGEKGGYWYERVREGLTPEMFGCTKMAVDKFTLSSTLICNAHSISHSLGTIPKFMFIIAGKKPTAYYNVYQVLSTNPHLNSEISSNIICYYSSGSYNADTVVINSITNNQFKVSNSTFKYSEGIEYTVITMA